MDPNQPSIVPWYLAAFWGVIIVVGCYTLLMLLAAVFPRKRRRWKRAPVQPFRVERRKETESRASVRSEQEG
jgi:hypothetical protein